MSNPTTETELECDQAVSPCSAIERILRPREADLGGFFVRRSLPTAQLKMVGPWIFFDHMGPVEYAAGEGLNVRPHPHVGLATVTYLFEGEILHRDSIGSVQPIRPGDINLMIAGRGVTHSESQESRIKARDHRLHGLQLWLALPREYEDMAPEFLHYPEAEIPETTACGVPVRVIMGSAYGCTSPVRTLSETLYVEARLQAGQTLRLPDARERAVYVVQGHLKALDSDIPEHAMAIFTDEGGIIVEAIEDTTLAIIGGDPLEKRYVEWNFVASSRERIDSAKQDWRKGRFPLVPGDDSDPIPLPD